MAKFISLYVKKTLRLDRLNFPQREMQRIGQYALDEWKARTTAAIGPEDSPAKPLTRGWAIAKAKMMSGRNATSAPARWNYESRLRQRKMRPKGQYSNPANWHIRSNKRDYTVTGELMEGLKLRQVSDNAARARWTTVKLRERAGTLSNIEAFVAFSPANRRKSVEFTRQILRDIAKRLIIPK